MRFARRMRKFRLTVYLVLTSLVVMTATTIAVNLFVGQLAEENLIRITEENTARDAAHVESMIRREQSMARSFSAEAAGTGGSSERGRQPEVLTFPASSTD